MKGTIRPIISLLFAGALIYGTMVIHIIDPKDFLLIATGAIGYWFVKRSQEKKQP